MATQTGSTVYRSGVPASGVNPLAVVAVSHTLLLLLLLFEVQRAQGAGPLEEGGVRVDGLTGVLEGAAGRDAEVADSREISESTGMTIYNNLFFCIHPIHNYPIHHSFSSLHSSNVYLKKIGNPTDVHVLRPSK